MAPPFFGPSENDPHTAAWVYHIGAFMLNFSTIEYLTHAWIALLTAPSVYEFSASLDFTQRIAFIKALIANESLEADLRSKIIKTLNQAESLSDLRNRLAHNPLLYIWKQGIDSNENAPDSVGIPKLKKKDETKLASLDEIEKGWKRAARISKTMYKHFATVRKIRIPEFRNT